MTTLDRFLSGYAVRFLTVALAALYLALYALSANAQTIPRTVTVIHRGVAREVTHEAARAKLMELLRTRRNPELLSALIRALGANTFCYDTPVCESHDGPCVCNRVEKR